MTQQVCPAPRGVKREAVFQGKQRIPGLWVRETKSGPVFEVQKRVDGRMRRIKLRAANKTDAINEARTLTVDVQRGDVQLGDRHAHRRGTQGQLPRPRARRARHPLEADH